MHFLITGITGFVGPYLAKELINKGHEVWGLTRRLVESEPTRALNIKYIHGSMEFFKKDYISHFKFDGVFNLASLTHPPTSFLEPEQYFEVNGLGTARLISALNKECVFMQCSTPEVYGICPEKEIYETFPMKPMNPYGVSKAAADLYILERTRNNKLNAFITRAGSHTGPGRPSCYSISSDAIQVARILNGKQDPVIKVGNLESRRAVMDVRDVVVAYCDLMELYMEEGVTNGDVFHISRHTPERMGYYLDLMLDMFNIKAEKIVDESLIRKIDIPIQILNSDKMRAITDWKPAIPIEETLRDLVNYWRENES